MKKNETTAVSGKVELYQKIARIMKLTLALLLFACLHVSAKGWSQERITLKMNSADIKKVLFAIEKKSSYRFLFNEEALKGKPKVTVEVVEALLPDVLDKLLANTGVSYKILGTNLVVLREGTESTNINVQEARITGKVVSASGEPLSGVSILIKGTRTGTTTDADGNFTLDAPDDAILLFTAVGYEALEVSVAGQTRMNITLQPSVKVEEQVVVVGYGTARRKDLTGSISSVSGEEISRMPTTNPINSLQGKVAGLTVSTSGRAGASPVVRIRGVNSPNSASPVYVVDGILHDNIDFLNPADIESVDILRDPSSIAIYGLRGANGVIAITLKKAARGQTRINFQTSAGIQKVTDKIKVVDAAGFKTLYNAQLSNLGAAPFDYSNYTGNTDWLDLVLRDAAFTNTNLSISNSGEKSNTYINLGYTNQDGVERYDNYERFLVRMTEEIRFSKSVKVGGDITAFHRITESPVSSIITNALWAAPIVPVQADENTYYSMPSFQRAQVGNPVANINRNRKNSVDKGSRLIGSLYAEIKFLKYFTWKSTVYADVAWNYSRSYTRLPYSFINLGENGAPTTTTYDNSARTTISQDQSESRRYQQDHTLTFDKKLGNGHSLNALLGFTTIYSTSSSVGANRRDTTLNVPDDPDFWYVNIVNANNPMGNSGGGSENAIVGSFARLSYSYKGRYLLNATIRRDGSSKFAPENRWGTFGSVGAGWVASEEDFIKKLSWIDYLKVRGAWGLTGNANGFADNLYKPGVQNASTAVFGDNIYSSIQASYIPDPDLHWETVQGLDLGLDFRTLNNRLNAEITFYNRTTTDLLTPLTLPNETRSYFTNLGKITNKGIEVSAGWNDHIGKDLLYRLSGNFSYNKNVVNSIGDNINFQLTGNGGVNLTTTGESVGYFYGYTQVGVYQSTADLAHMPSFTNSLPGDIAYADLNGDGVITPADRSNIGSPFPPYSFGGSIELEYKGFDFEIAGQGFAGHKIYTQRKTATFAVLNYEANRLNAWTAPGTSNIEPVLDNTRGNNFLVSTYYLEPGDFFRIRNIQLGYAFSSSLLKRIKIDKARIYISGQNIKTWSKVTGFSPEPLIGSILGGGADNGAYPVPAVYSVGLNITF